MMDDLFKFQLEIIKQELNSIEKIIDRIDTTTQTIKYWTIVSWTGSVGFALGKTELNEFILLSGILPVLFWILDARWRRQQKRSVFRSHEIKKFLNDKRLEISFKENRIMDFDLYDPTGNSYTNEADYRKKVSILKTIFYPEVIIFYLSLIVISIILSLFI